MGIQIDQIETVPDQPLDTPDESVVLDQKIEFNTVRRLFDLGEDIFDEDKRKIEEITSHLIDDKVPKSEWEYYLRTIERKIGGPNLGETRHGKIWRYLMLDRRIKALQKEKDNYGTNNS